MKVHGVVYKITYLVENRIVYIGQTIGSIEDRFKRHCEPGAKQHISYFMRSRGKKNFKIEQIDIAYNQDELNLKEIEGVLKYNCLWPNGLNHRVGGDQKGFVSDATKQLISLKKMGKPNLLKRGELRNDEYRIKIARGLGGKPIKGVHRETGEVIILQTAREGIKYGFNPSNIVSICRGKRPHSKGFVFNYIEDANQSGSLG